MRSTFSLWGRVLALPVLIGSFASPVSAVTADAAATTTPPPAPEPGILALAALGGVAAIAVMRARRSTLLA